jgi:hypothetical protein
LKPKKPMIWGWMLGGIPETASLNDMKEACENHPLLKGFQIEARAGFKLFVFFSTWVRVLLGSWEGILKSSDVARGRSGVMILVDCIFFCCIRRWPLLVASKAGPGTEMPMLDGTKERGW